MPKNMLAKANDLRACGCRPSKVERLWTTGRDFQLSFDLGFDLSGRTTQLSSGGGRVSYEPQKSYVPPPSAAAPGSALFLVHLLIGKSK